MPTETPVPPTPEPEETEETFAGNADHVAFLVDGYVAGPTAVTVARRNFPGQFLHYHRAGHGAVTSPQM